MTCIVGIVDSDGSIYMGGDSAGCDGNHLDLRKDPKVFLRNPFIFGFSSSFRMGQLLMCDSRFGFRKQEDDEDDYIYMVDAFIPAVIDLFDKGGYLSKQNNVISGGIFLVGYKSRLYEINSDFQVKESLKKYASCGCGRDISYGSLYSTEKSNMSCGERILMALEAASEFSSWVSPPFNIIVKL
jgi:hypothetical protein